MRVDHETDSSTGTEAFAEGGQIKCHLTLFYKIKGFVSYRCSASEWMFELQRIYHYFRIWFKSRDGKAS